MGGLPSGDGGVSGLLPVSSGRPARIGGGAAAEGYHGPGDRRSGWAPAGGPPAAPPHGTAAGEDRPVQGAGSLHRDPSPLGRPHGRPPRQAGLPPAGGIRGPAGKGGKGHGGALRPQPGAGKALRGRGPGQPPGAGGAAGPGRGAVPGHPLLPQPLRLLLLCEPQRGKVPGAGGALCGGTLPGDRGHGGSGPGKGPSSAGLLYGGRYPHHPQRRPAGPGAGSAAGLLRLERLPGVDRGGGTAGYAG